MAGGGSAGEEEGAGASAGEAGEEGEVVADWLGVGGVGVTEDEGMGAGNGDAGGGVVGEAAAGDWAATEEIGRHSDSAARSSQRGARCSDPRCTVS